MNKQSWSTLITYKLWTRCPLYHQKLYLTKAERHFPTLFVTTRHATTRNHISYGPLNLKSLNVENRCWNRGLFVRTKLVEIKCSWALTSVKSSSVSHVTPFGFAFQFYYFPSTYKQLVKSKNPLVKALQTPLQFLQIKQQLKLVLLSCSVLKLYTKRVTLKNESGDVLEALAALAAGLVASLRGRRHFTSDINSFNRPVAGGSVTNKKCVNLNLSC